jgi:tripartite-type tricarboxylate transporter receptor subunit TctC
MALPKRKRNLSVFAVVAAVTAASLPAMAQSYPTKPVQLVVAYAPGGTGDVVARIMAARLTDALKQSVVVENRPGASGAIGAQSVARAAPDGHTLLVGQTGEIVVNPHWVKGLGYDPDKDLLPVALASVVPLALVVPGNATLGELLATARGGPKPLSFASAGIGTPGHFAGEALKLKADGKMVHVPYKGAGPALNDILGGHVDLYFSGLPAAMPHVKAGKIKILAVSTAKRSGSAADIPAVAETAGFDGFDISLWQAFFAPRGTPTEIVQRLNSTINAILAEPETRKRLQDLGAEVTPLSLDGFAAFVRAQNARYSDLVKATGVTSQQ